MIGRIRWRSIGELLPSVQIEFRDVLGKGWGPELLSLKEVRTDA